MAKFTGKLPYVVAKELHLDVEQVAYYLYLPVSLPGSDNILLPLYLKEYEPLILVVRDNEPIRFKNEYVYITIKRMIVGPSVTPNRPGWHADGFGSDDLNYVWYDCVPTIFNSTVMEVSDDHIKSLKEMDEKINLALNVTYPEYSLLKLDSTMIHAVNDATKEVMRTFVKVSISKQRYNLKGNSVNPLIEGGWKMYDRKLVRNDPHKAQLDYYGEDDHFK